MSIPLKARVFITLKNGVLDPQGKAVTQGLHHMGLTALDNVRIGKHISIQVEAKNEDEARTKVEESCKKLLANLIMESYTFSLKKA